MSTVYIPSLFSFFFVSVILPAFNLLNIKYRSERQNSPMSTTDTMLTPRNNPICPPRFAGICNEKNINPLFSIKVEKVQGKNMGVPIKIVVNWRIHKYFEIRQREKIWLSPMTEFPTPTENQNNATKNVRLHNKRMVSWSNYCHATSVVIPVSGVPTFPLATKIV